MLVSQDRIAFSIHHPKVGLSTIFRFIAYSKLIASFLRFLQVIWLQKVP